MAEPPTGDLSIPATDRGTALLVVVWMCAAIAVIVVAIRFYVRTHITEKVRINDWVILLTLVMALVLSCFCTVAVHWGLGQHIKRLSPQQITYSIKWVYLTEFFAIMTPNFGRISFALLLLDLIPPSKWRRNTLWAIILLQTVVDVITVVITYIQCSPVQGYWDHTIKAKCWPPYVQTNTGYFQGSFCALVDLSLALFPASLIWKLQMKLSTRVSLLALMGLGIFSMAASIAKTIELKNINATEDLTYALAALAYCFTLEAYTVLIAGSIPTLRPLVSHSRGHRSSISENAKSPRRYLTGSKYRGDRSRYYNDKNTPQPPPQGPFVPLQPYRSKPPKVYSSESTAEEDEILYGNNITKQTHMEVFWERRPEAVDMSV